MKISLKYTFVALLCYFSLQSPVFGAETLVDESTGTEFPVSMNVEKDGQVFELAITGIATRSKFFVKIYSVAHYMQDPIKGSRKAIIEDIVSDGKTKVLKYVWQRKVDAERIHEAYDESFKNNLTEEQLERLQPQIDKLLEFLAHNAKSEDIHEYRWFPGGELEFWINGKKIGSFKNAELAKGLWGFWFGTQSVVKRNDLISQYKK